MLPDATSINSGSHPSREDLRKFLCSQAKEVKNLTTVKEYDGQVFTGKRLGEKKRRMAGVEKSRNIKEPHFQPTKSKCKALQGGTNDFNLTDSFGRLDSLSKTEVAHEKVGGERQQHQDDHSRCLSSFLGGSWIKMLPTRNHAANKARHC